MPILALYSGLLGLILIYLSYAVAGQRKRFKIGVGDGDNPELCSAIRVHGNFIEYVPIALILLAVFESNNGHYLVEHIIGSILVVGRLLHAYGLGKSTGTSVGRLVGTVLTWLVILVLSGFNIYFFVNNQLA